MICPRGMLVIFTGGEQFVPKRTICHPIPVHRRHSSRRIFKNKKNVRTDEPDKKYFGRMYNTSSFSTRWICFYIQEINILTRNPPQYDKRTPWSPEALQKSEEWPGKHYTSTGAVLQQRPAGTASCGKRYLSG